MIVNSGTSDERAVRVVLESENFGREYFDHGSLELCMGCLIRIVKEVLDSANDDVERVVGIAIIPPCEYGVKSGYYPEFEDEELGCKAHFANQPISEGVAAMEVLAQMPASAIAIDIDEAAPVTGISGVKPLSTEELRELIICRADKTHGYDPAIRRFCKDLLEIIAGRKGEKTLDNALQRLLEAEATN